jgi:ApbE superfamily uncharacterized protein (UPF0280 family)
MSDCLNTYRNKVGKTSVCVGLLVLSSTAKGDAGFVYKEIELLPVCFSKVL